MISTSEDGDDFHVGIIGTDSESESDDKPNGVAPLVDLAEDSDSRSDTDSLIDLGDGDHDAFSSGSEAENVAEVHVIPDADENLAPYGITAGSIAVVSAAVNPAVSSGNRHHRPAHRLADSLASHADPRCLVKVVQK